MSSLLEVRDLEAGYGKTRVLKNLSITVGAGEAVAVLGANGAGKSTLMKCIAGLVRPWSGQVLLDGKDVTSVPAEHRAALGVVLAPEGRGIFATLSIEENLLVGATCLGRRFGAREAGRHMSEGLTRVFDLFGVLKIRRKDLASKLSGGQQQMLAIGRALMAQPKLLLLDEPSMGLAPLMVKEVMTILGRL